MRRFRCPYCGGNELQGRFCAYCDSLILEEEPQETPQAPARQEKTVEALPVTKRDVPDVSVYREYHGLNTLVELQADGFVVVHKILGQPDRRNRIRYEDIRGLYYFRPENKFSAYGYIVIRWTGNEHLPVPIRKECTRSLLREEETMIGVCSGQQDWVFTSVFWFLRSMAPAGIPWQIDCADHLPPNADALTHQADFDWHFANCSPVRESAVYLLRKELSLDKKKARALVNKVFDQKQAVLYEEDTNQAKWDLQVMVKLALNERWITVLKR